MIRKCECCKLACVLCLAAHCRYLFVVLGNMFLHSFVGIFISRKERMKDMVQNPRFTNLYIKNFGDDLGDDELGELFSAHGKVLSAVVMKDKSSGRSLGFGFVSFEDHMSAAKASLGGYSSRVLVRC